MTPIKLFISYSHTDEILKKGLEKHLSTLTRNNQIEIWHDRKIYAGENFANVIDDKLKSSQIILLLVSSDFIDSNYCFEIEMREALKLHEQNKAIVVPIILRDCRWQNLIFGKLTALPTDGKAISGKDWHNKDEAFTDVEKGIEEIINKINSLTDKKNELTESKENVDVKTLAEAIEVFKLESQKLDYKSTKQDFENFSKLKREIYLQLFDDIDQRIENTPNLKSKQASELFDMIFMSETLDQMTIQDILKIRGNKELYHWYERVLIVSALSISLISFRKFDQKKANLLIDFLSDFEDNVWEKALTGLVLGLIHHQNKWTRFNDLKKRLELFRDIERVQAGLNIIENILIYNLFEESSFNSKIYSRSFFESPSNCFLPFYAENPVLKKSIDSAKHDTDTDNFRKMILELPLLDSVKYSLCFKIDNFKFRKRTPSSKEKKEANAFYDQLFISSVLNPYQNILSNFYVFFKHYPLERIENIFSDHLSIAKTKLKDVVLNKVNHLKLTAKLKIEQGNYLEAISKLVDLLKIKPDEYSARWDIIICYTSLPKANYSEALVHLLVLEEDSKDIEITNRIADCYCELNLFEKSVEYYAKSLLINSKIELTYIGLAECYKKQKKYDKLIETLKKGESLFPSSYIFLKGLGDTYASIDDFILSNNYYKKSLPICPNDRLHTVHRGIAANYEDLDEPDLALQHALKSYDFCPTDYGVLWTLGRIYFTGKINLDLAKKYLGLALKKEKGAIIYGNLAHIELCENNRNGAIKYYKLCIEAAEGEEEFTKMYNFDMKYLLKYGIAEKEYISIRNEITTNWLAKKH